MERHEVLAALKNLRLYGMASALEEAVSTGIKRNRSPWEVLAELVESPFAPATRACTTPSRMLHERPDGFRVGATCLPVDLKMSGG